MGNDKTKAEEWWENFLPEGYIFISCKGMSSAEVLDPNKKMLTVKERHITLFEKVFTI